jgi:hypothetical protein
MWLWPLVVSLPVVMAVVPLWQVKQALETPESVWSNFTAVHDTVTWHVMQLSDVFKWVPPRLNLPVAMVPLWQDSQAAPFVVV